MSDQMPPRPPGIPTSHPVAGQYGGGSTPPPPVPGAYVPPPGQNAYGQPFAPYGFYPAFAQQRQQTNGFAVASLVLGILTLPMCYLGIITGLLGIVFGILGIRQVNDQPERFVGKGLAVAGIILSAIFGLLWGGLFLATWLVPSTY